MTTFDATWLAQYQTKMATFRGAPLPDLLPPPDLIEFSIPHATMLLNPLLRLHWAKRRAYQKGIAAEIFALTPQYRACEPMRRARVTITRYSTQLPDADGLVGGMKPVIDCLLARSDRHPDGLGFLVDDGPAHMEMSVSSVRVSKQAQQRTNVLIERLA